MARILAADDSVVAQKLYTHMFESLGHKTVVCSNGREAVEAFREIPAELVILDVSMPEMNGFDACREIRKLPDGINVPIIMVSAEDSEENIMNGLNAGANDYLVKPVKAAHIIAKLKTFLKYSSVHKSDWDLVRNHVEIAGKYEIEKILGYGAHSVVFQAKDKGGGKDVAIKFITTPEIEDFAKNFIDTASKIKELSSPHILGIFDYGQFVGRFYVILEYAEGGDLAAILKRRRFSEPEAVKLAIDIVRGLKDLSGKGIIHFDIKPENIMLAGNEYKLGDFGVIAARESGTVPLRMEMWSTVAYLPPEYLNETGSVDSRSDIYSTGITLYQAITNDNPFQSDKPAVSMFRQLNLIPPSLKSFDDKITTHFSELVRGMMEKDPANRPSLDNIENILLHIKELHEFHASDLPERKAAGEGVKKKLDSLVPSAIRRPHQMPSPAFASKTRGTKLPWEVLAKIVACCILALLLFIGIGYTVNHYYSSGLDSIPLETRTSMICANCCIPIKMENGKELEKEKCAKCGKKMFYCDQCRNCGLTFAHPDIPPLPSGVTESVFGPTHLATCPACSSADIRGF